jgi:hypothetical protein
MLCAKRWRRSATSARLSWCSIRSGRSASPHAALSSSPDREPEQASGDPFHNPVGSDGKLRWRLQIDGLRGRLTSDDAISAFHAASVANCDTIKAATRARLAAVAAHLDEEGARDS